MSKKIFIDGTTESELCIVAAEGKNIEYFDFSINHSKSKKNNIYLCIVSRVEPSLQAAFVEYGEDKKAFLPFDEIHPSYFKIPSTDKKFNEKSGDELTNEVQDDKVDKKNFLSFYRKYKIQDVIKKDQVLLIQIIKEERGSKGAAVSTFISLPGRNCVLLPNNSVGGGVSKKISNHSDRKRLKLIHDDLSLPEGMSLIIRTNSEKSSKEEITNDYEYLKKLWTEIRNSTLKSKAPSLIYELDSPLIKVIRDVYNSSFKEIIVSDLKVYKSFKKIEKNFYQNKKSIIKHHKDGSPIFESNGIKNPIQLLSKTNVYLKSGGYLVINPTEALTSIDINSGKSTSEKNIEITALNTNLEACEEIFKQIQLRNIAGLVVIDFIDMSIGSNNYKVESRIKSMFQKDKSRVQLSKISQFGLLEISRQRIGNSIYEIFFENCSCCGGDNHLKSRYVILYELMSLIRNIENLKDETLVEIKIDKDFYEENKEDIGNRMKINFKSTIEYNFIEEKNLIEKFSFSKDILDKIQKNIKVIKDVIKKEPKETVPVKKKSTKSKIIKKVVVDNESKYRRKIKKKIPENLDSLNNTNDK